MTEDLKRIETVLDEKVRPALRAHGGDITADRLENGVLYVKLLGQCAGCPSADLTWCGRWRSSRTSVTSCGSRRKSSSGTTICKRRITRPPLSYGVPC